MTTQLETEYVMRKGPNYIQGGSSRYAKLIDPTLPDVAHIVEITGH
jgi:hypothetical protein